MTHYLTHLDNIIFKKLTLDELETHLPELSFDSPDLSGTLKIYLTHCQNEINQLIENNISSLSTHHLRSLMIDQLVIRLFNKFMRESTSLKPDSMLLVAVGGYGREEMSLGSDIDLNFIVDAKQHEAAAQLVQNILYPLWDAKLDIGHALRTLPDALTLLKSDQTILTSFLDARYITGNKALFDKLQDGISHVLAPKKIRLKLIHDKMTERDARLKKFGDSVYLLKPNVKEGPGALRDLHLLRWLPRLMGHGNSFGALLKHEYINEDEYKALDFGLKFFLQIRNRLHYQLKKKSDQMGFEQQLQIAKELGFSDTANGILAVEHFMQTYYSVASQTRAICQKVIFRIRSDKESLWDRLKNRLSQKNLDTHFKIVRQKIMLRDLNLFQKEPQALLKAFWHVQETGLSLHHETKNQISSHLYLVDKRFRENPQVASLFRKIMGGVKNLGKALLAMHDTHFFDAYIPEFRKLRNRVQHDIYHVYTVDAHSIFAVGELGKLAQGELPGEFEIYRLALSQIKNPEVLTMGLLFHDVGKGEGGSHSAAGAKLADGVALRLGFAEEHRHTIRFLVLSHLMMSHLSQRRDLEDKHLINEFAKTMGSVDTLNMLFVLTWADIRAVSPESWTAWKGTLLKSLYEKTHDILKKGDFSETLELTRIADIRQNILERLKGQADASSLQEFLEMITPRYVRTHTESEILEHFTLIEKHRHENFFLKAAGTEDGHATEVLIYTTMTPRTLSLITGVMLSLGLNILTLEAFGLSNGSLLVKLQVQTEFHAPITKADTEDKLKTRLKNVFRGQDNIQSLIAGYKKPLTLSLNKPVGLAKSEITIDNDVSPFYTVIDIFTHDRIGLLHDIITCLAEQGCYVEISKISTKVEQVVDTFYVKDIFGGKITSKNKLREIHTALMQVIEPLADTVQPHSQATPEAQS